VVQSAGNYYNKSLHSSGILRAGERNVLAVRVDPADTTSQEIEVWYPGADVCSVRIKGPDGAGSKWVDADGVSDIIHGGVRRLLYLILGTAR
jgi:hypothetical protein